MDRCVRPSGTARSGGGDTGQKSLSGPCADGLPTACPVCPRDAVRLLDRRCGGRNNPKDEAGQSRLTRCARSDGSVCNMHTTFPSHSPPTTAQNTDQLLLCQKVGPSPVRGAGLAAAHSHGRQRLNAGAILVLSTGKTDVTAARWVQPVPESRPEVSGYRFARRERHDETQGQRAASTSGSVTMIYLSARQRLLRKKETKILKARLPLFDI
ncbi:hypothetical protein CCHR01_02307 [Colletotrichum chrysophilum]|uniref:Uncharacterized protein n=1 Tax=Colletotrichum chrysophilum TaxID=1836956 RepID=A0AAD9AX56_9PEZI|nr:hypothetical protein CCHR01_02307 [Colletotrichum chrysophilum]